MRTSGWVESVGTRGAGGARVVADSISPWNHRLTTIEVTLHRSVLAELDPHRVLSRNCARSDAIPLAELLQRVLENPAAPVEWRSEPTGKQGGGVLEPAAADEAERHWLVARNMAAAAARVLAAQGAHRSIVSRLLEPFTWHTVIVTATEWGVLGHQRWGPLAPPEIRVAVEAVRVALDASEPIGLQEGEWHLPYVRDEDRRECGDRLDLLRRISVARCARGSHLTRDGVRSPEADVALYERLISADPHASPLEHVATPANPGPASPGPSGNLAGWRQMHDVPPSERATEPNGKRVPCRTNDEDLMGGPP